MSATAVEQSPNFKPSRYQTSYTTSVKTVPDEFEIDTLNATGETPRGFQGHETSDCQR